MWRGLQSSLLSITFIAWTSLAVTKEPGKLGLEAENAWRLIGTPVYASDGAIVGELSDVIFAEDGQPREVHVTAGTRLGFGARTFQVRRGGFFLKHGAIVLDMPAEALQALPELIDHEKEK